MKYSNPLRLSIVVFIIMLLPFTLLAMSGLEIAKRVEHAREGYVDAVTSLELVIIDSSGQMRTKKVLFKQKEKAESLDGSIGETSMMIISPSQCHRSVAILTKEDEAKQWVFLPALRKIRSISSAMTSGTLAGSEFSYEDLAGQSILHYHYSESSKVIDHKGEKVWQFERYSKNEHSQYGRQVLFVDHDDHRLYQIDYYDPKGTLFKTLTFDGYHTINGLQRFKEIKMLNHKNGCVSIMKVKSEQLDSGLGSEEFDHIVLQKKMKHSRCIF